MTGLVQDDISASDLLDCEKLYALIHQRYILTAPGLQLIKHKILRGECGFCPRVLCPRQPVIPYGEHAEFGKSGTRLYCPNCSRLYDPDYERHRRLDGSHFGPNLAAEIMLTFPGLK